MSGRLIIAILLLLLAGGGVAAFIMLPERLPRGPVSPAPVVQFADTTQKVALRTVLLQQQDDDKKMFVCRQKTCETLRQPAALNNEAVFDGSGWLYYQRAASEVTKLEKKILQRQTVADGSVQQLMEATPLTSPRGLFISPDGKKIAFFLDNVDKPKEELTEVWVYEVGSGTRLLAEKLFAPDIRSRVRWNRASSLLWFVADNAPQDSREDMLELVTVQHQPAKVAVSFPKLNWQKLLELADEGILDINPDGTKIAFLDEQILVGQVLTVANQQGSESRLSMRGEVKYLAWLDADRLLYAVQDGEGFTFWQQQNGVNKYVARRPGVLRAVHGDASREHAVMAVQESDATKLYSLNIASGVVREEAPVPEAEGELHIVQVAQEEIPQTAAVRNVTRTLEDDEIVAFIDRHFAILVSEPTARPRRVLISDQENTVYVDYAAQDAKEHRVLLTVHDAALNEWSIRARYEAKGAEWQKVQGGGLQDPKPVRLYEWEESLRQWILKDKF